MYGAQYRLAGFLPLLNSGKEALHMKLEKCPVCTAKMKEQNGRMVCPQCGYYQIIDNASASARISDTARTGQQSDNTSHSSGRQSGSIPYSGQQSTNSQYRPSGTPNGSSYRTSASQQTNHTAGSQAGPRTGPNPTIYPQRNITVSSTKNYGSSVSAPVITGVVIVICIVLIIFVSAVLSIISFNKKTDSTTAISDIAEEKAQNVDIVSSVPQSESFQVLVSQVLEMDFDDITPQDLAKITEIDFYYDTDDRKCISCYLTDGTEHDYFLNEELYMDLEDLSCFTGVEHLTIEFGYLKPENLRGMESLVSIASEMTPSELAAAVPNPQNMEAIQVYSTIFANSCDGIENFPNLKRFYIEGSSLTDISALSDVPGLQHLSLTDCNSLTDFAPLYDLTKLQSLDIDSSSLKDIGFVQNMPDLSWLSIHNTDDLLSIDPLEACNESLTALFLENTWGLHDFHIVEQLTKLEQLELYLTYEDTLPSFAGMEQLEILRLYGAYDLHTVAEAKNLTYLSLEGCNCEDLSFLAQLQNLTNLDLADMSGYYVSFDPVLALPKLEVLDISGSTAYADATPLLGIPTLKELYMNECNIGFRPDAVPYNEGLLLLDMNDVSLYPIGEGYGSLQDEDEIALSQHTELFANFPNLCYLYLSSSQLDDLSFITEGGLSSLQMLDITDNYVVDLSPLAQLEDLWYVKCPDNPIAETAGLDDILVR